MKRLMCYKCEVEKYLSDAKSSYEIWYAEVTAYSFLDAMRMAATEVGLRFFKCLMIDNGVDADPDAIESVQWLTDPDEIKAMQLYMNDLRNKA